jgi:hypothetical protein
LAIYERPEFVETLVKQFYNASDFVSEGSCERSPLMLYLSLYYPKPSIDIGIHRFILSCGAYDDVCLDRAMYDWSMPKPSVITQLHWWGIVCVMARTLEHFQSLQTTFFPNFYQQPFEMRLWVIRTADIMDPRAVARFFRDSDSFHPDDVRYKDGSRNAFDTIAHRWASNFVFGKFMKSSWQWFYERSKKDFLSVIRSMASVLKTSELSRPSGTYTPLLDVLRTLTLSVLEEHPSTRVTCCSCVPLEAKAAHEYAPVNFDRQRREVQQYLRDWVKSIKEAGHDLGTYGEAETVAFKKIPSFLFRQTTPYIGLCSMPGCKNTVYMTVDKKVVGITFGANPEDWDVLWDIYVRLDEEEEDEMQRALWYKDVSKEPGQRGLMPGSWVDDDQDEFRGEGDNDIKEEQQDTVEKEGGCYKKEKENDKGEEEQEEQVQMYQDESIKIIAKFIRGNVGWYSTFGSSWNLRTTTYTSYDDRPIRKQYTQAANGDAEVAKAPDDAELY